MCVSSLLLSSRITLHLHYVVLLRKIATANQRPTSEPALVIHLVWRKIDVIQAALAHYFVFCFCYTVAEEQIWRQSAAARILRAVFKCYCSSRTDNCPFLFALFICVAGLMPRTPVAGWLAAVICARGSPVRIVRFVCFNFNCSTKETEFPFPSSIYIKIHLCEFLGLNFISYLSKTKRKFGFFSDLIIPNPHLIELEAP